MTPTEETYYRRYLNDIPFGGAQVQAIPYFPVLTFSDTATRANGDLGNNWLTQGRPSSGSGGQECGCTINSNKFRFTAPILGGNNNNPLNNVVWIPRQLISTDPNTNLPGGIWTKNQYVNITYQAVTTTSSCRIGVALHAKYDEGGSAGQAQAYHLIVHYNSGSFQAIDLIRTTGGENESGATFSTLITSAVAPLAGDILELDSLYNSGATSVTLTYKKNGTQIFQYVDNSPLPQIGYPVMSFLTSLGNTTADFTNFNCGNL